MQRKESAANGSYLDVQLVSRQKSFVVVSDAPIGVIDHREMVAT